MLCYEFLSGIASSVLKVNCYQWGSCVGGPSAFNSPFGHRSRSHNICPLDNHLSGLSISLSSLVLSWVYRLPFFKSLVWLGCDSNSQPSVLVASTLPLHYQSVEFRSNLEHCGEFESIIQNISPLEIRIKKRVINEDSFFVDGAPIFCMQVVLTGGQNKTENSSAPCYGARTQSIGL